jgi:4-hydroxy-tetrahydrodipicolinate synthase
MVRKKRACEEISMKISEIKGLFTALITPFKNGALDEEAYVDFIEWQIAEGVHGLVPCGTTGESPTLSPQEHRRVVELCVKTAAGRVPVMAGTGSNSTEEAIAFTRHAQDAGADMALLVTPYYNKPTQEGLYLHFREIHDNTDIPLIIYNIPGRSVVNLTDDTLAQLATLPNVMGVKDATGDLARVSTLRHKVGDQLAQLSGEDMTAHGFNAMGGQGCISVTANIAPKLCAEVQSATLNGDYARALAVQDTLAPLHTAMFCETNPVPVKYAASLLGRCTPEIRLPLTPPSPEARQKISDALRVVGLL